MLEKLQLIVKQIVEHNNSIYLKDNENKDEEIFFNLTYQVFNEGSKCDLDVSKNSQFKDIMRIFYYNGYYLIFVGGDFNINQNVNNYKKYQFIDSNSVFEFIKKNIRNIDN